MAQYNLPSVILPFVDDSTDAYCDGEPQMVKTMVPNRSQIHVTSRSRETGTVTSFTTRLTGNYGKSRKIQAAAVIANLSIPNVNIRMNVVAFTILSDMIARTATIPNGFYTQAEFIVALQAQMNAPSIALPAGVSFVCAYNPRLHGITITCIADQFQFDTCTMYTRGVYFLQFPALGVMGAQHIMSNLTMVYSPAYYIDIPQIRGNAKLKSMI